MNTFLAAYIFVFFSTIAALFQLALAAGMPWGELAMGGKFPGQFPPAMRFVCLIQIVVLMILSLTVFTRAGIIWPEGLSISRYIIWGVVVFTVLSVIANLATPSKWERIIWAPVTIVLMICTVVVAVS